MARAQSKSELIRAALTELGPEARNRDVIAKLAGDRVKVSAQMVSTVRKRANGALASGNDVRRPGRPSRQEPAAAKLSLAALLNAKRLVGEAGSVAAARQTLDALAKLV